MSDDLKVVELRCQSCGASLDTSKSKCDYCGTSFIVEGMPTTPTLYGKPITKVTKEMLEDTPIPVYWAELMKASEKFKTLGLLGR
jgi:hypothetical protein